MLQEAPPESTREAFLSADLRSVREEHHSQVHKEPQSLKKLPQERKGETAESRAMMGQAGQVREVSTCGKVYSRSSSCAYGQAHRGVPGGLKTSFWAIYSLLRLL